MIFLLWPDAEVVDEEINKPTGYKRTGEEMAAGDAASNVFECFSDQISPAKGVLRDITLIWWDNDGFCVWSVHKERFVCSEHFSSFCVRVCF